MVPLRLVIGKEQNDSSQTLDFDEVRMPKLLSVPPAIKALSASM